MIAFFANQMLSVAEKVRAVDICFCGIAAVRTRTNDAFVSGMINVDRDTFIKDVALSIPQ